MDLEYDDKLHFVLSAYYNLQNDTYQEIMINEVCILKDDPQCFCLGKNEASSAGCAIICGIEKEQSKLKCSASFEPLSDEYTLLSEEEGLQYFSNVGCYNNSLFERIALFNFTDVVFPDNYSSTMCQLYTILALHLSQYETIQREQMSDGRHLFLLAFLSLVNRVFAEKYYSALISLMASLTDESSTKRQLANYICNFVEKIYMCSKKVNELVDKKFLIELIVRASNGRYGATERRTEVLAKYAFSQKKESFLDLTSRTGFQSELRNSFESIHRLVQNSTNKIDDFLRWYQETKGWVI